MSSKRIPEETIRAFARSISQEAKKYGFTRLDAVRLINALMDVSMDAESGPESVGAVSGGAGLSIADAQLDVSSFPLRGARLSIRRLNPQEDLAILAAWLSDRYGRYFVLSCATAQEARLEVLCANPHNHIGVVLLPDGLPIGAVAFLDHDPVQRRAELRKLIGVPAQRGKGFAEEATVLWLKYGFEQLGLEKVYLSTLQTHLRNVQLNESIGFRVEGVLVDEVLIDGQRHDVLRMGICRPD